jgi:hypothetical protein
LLKAGRRVDRNRAQHYAADKSDSDCLIDLAIGFRVFAKAFAEIALSINSKKDLRSEWEKA